MKTADLIQNHRKVFINYITNNLNYDREGVGILTRLYDSKINGDNIMDHVNKSAQLIYLHIVNERI